MTDSRERFMHLLKTEILQLDQPDLDFGIYRILNFRRIEIERFFDEELPAVLEKAVASAADISADEEGEDSPFSQSELDRLYNHLYVFFSRYYRDGDFQPQPRRAREARYSVPYNGEDVHFYWRSFGSHYVKTAEELRSYRFKSGKQAVRFELVDAYEEPDNVKGAARYFVPIVNDCEIRTEPSGPVFVVPFAFHRLTAADEKKYKAKSEDLDGNSVQERIISDLSEEIPVPSGLAKIDLIRHLRRYSARARRDYFVHPDLGVFLQGELEYYLKNEVIPIGDSTEVESLGDRLSKVRVLRQVGGRIVEFLDSLEALQSRLFEKRKFVLDVQYLVPCSMVPSDLRGEVLQCEAQLRRWSEETGIEIYDEEILKAYGTLVIDTSLFDQAFRDELIASVDDLDEATCGLVVAAENYAALRTLTPLLGGQVAAIYIDPPYNTGSDGFLYLDEFSRHSTWLSLMAPRLRLARELLRDDAAAFVSVDDNEVHNLRLAMDAIFAPSNFLGTVVRATGTSTGQDSTGFGGAFDFLLAYARDESFELGGLPLSEKDISRFNEEDYRGKYSTLQLRKTGNNDRREDRPLMYYPVVAPDGTEVYPLGPSGYESCWRVGPSKYEQLVEDDFIVWKQTMRDGSEVWAPYVKYYLEGRDKRPSSLWNDIDGNKKATHELKAVLGDTAFTHPKPLELLERVISLSSQADTRDVILDFFAGSGTTGHAVLSANQRDGGNRRFVLVEMGDHVEEVIKPRLRRILMSSRWADGKAIDFDALGASLLPEDEPPGPKIVKMISLERFEDTLNALSLVTDKKQSKLHLTNSISVVVPADARSSLMNTEQLEHPFSYTLDVHKDDGVRATRVDLVETFNLVAGIAVEKLRYSANYGREYGFVSGMCGGSRVLVVWRDVEGLDPAEELSFLLEEVPRITGRDLNSFDLIWHNADSVIPNGQSLDAEFNRRMFEPEPGVS